MFTVMDSPSQVSFEAKYVILSNMFSRNVGQIIGKSAVLLNNEKAYIFSLYCIVLIKVTYACL